MYLRAVYAESDISLLQNFIKDNPLGILTTAIKSATYPFIQSSHIPFVLDIPNTSQDDEHSEKESIYGVLRGHVAKQNPQAKVLIEALAAVSNEYDNSNTQQKINELPDEVLVLFNGPVHHYVTPKFYVETKPATGKVAPTWNYSAVQVYGKIRVYGDSKSDESSNFIQRQIEDLSHHAEISLIQQYTGCEESTKPSPWAVSDAPSSYVDMLKKNIIGIEIQIHRLEGKFKMSQEKGLGDREGIIQGFANLGTETGQRMAKTVKERADLQDKRV